MVLGVVKISSFIKDSLISPCLCDIYGSQVLINPYSFLYALISPWFMWCVHCYQSYNSLYQIFHCIWCNLNIFNWNFYDTCSSERKNQASLLPNIKFRKFCPLKSDISSCTHNSCQKFNIFPFQVCTVVSSCIPLYQFHITITCYLCLIPTFNILHTNIFVLLFG